MAKFKLKAPYGIDPVARYEVPFTPDNVGDDNGLVAKANDNGTMIVNKNIPLNSKLRKEAESHEDHHLKDMMDGKLAYDDDAVYHNLDGKGVKRVDRKNFNESDKSLPWEKDAYKAGDNLEEKDMRPNPNKLSGPPNMKDDTPLAFQKIGSRHKFGRQSDINKVSHSENFGPSMKKSWGTDSPLSKKEKGPGGNVSVITGAAPGQTPSGVTNAKLNFDKIKDYAENSLTSIGQEAINPDFTFKGLDGEMYDNKADYLKASKKVLANKNQKSIDNVLDSFSGSVDNSKVRGGGNYLGSGTAGKVDNYTAEDFKKGLLISGVPGTNKGTVPLSNKFVKGLKLPTGNPDQVNEALTPRTSDSNKDTRYVLNNYTPDSGDPLAVENFGYEHSYNQDSLKPIDIKRFNSATFDVDKGVVKTQMADKGDKIDASKTKADFVNVSTPELQIKDVKGDVNPNANKKRFKDLKVNEKLSNLSVDRQLSTNAGWKKGGKAGSKFKKRLLKRPVQKLSGVVDLDMSGDVDSDIERNAKAFTGGNIKDGSKAKIYSNRRDARRSTKGRKQAVEGAGLKNIGRIKTKALQGRDFEYTVGGEEVKKGDFVKKANFQRDLLKNMEKKYNTGQLNAGAGITSLKGDNSFANKFNVDYPSYTGQGEVNRLKEEDIKNINFDQYSKRQKKKINRKIKKIRNV